MARSVKKKLQAQFYLYSLHDLIVHQWSEPCDDLGKNLNTG